ncbi:MAG: hypothetical protein K9I82_02440 [Chitinophagaceae bacterium]|nr:hypothetical protein [Chitinophagaceae bacterium]
MKTQIITDDVFYVDIVRFCEANDIADIDEFVSQCLKSGFFIEKYGMLNNDIDLVDIEPKEKIVEVFVDRVIEVVKEVPVDRIVEVIKEVTVYKEVIREVPNGEVRVVEVIKEVPVIKEVYVLKEIPTNNPELENELNETKVKLTNLIVEIEKKNRIIQEYRALFETSKQTARYHKSSNIKIS